MELALKIKSKDTVVKCLKINNATEYQDTVIKYLQYNNFTSKSLQVTNICETTLILPAQPLFNQQDNLGSTFIASIDNTTIVGGQTVDVPVYYNGRYRGADNSPLYLFSFYGQSVKYRLNIVNNDNIGSIEDFTIIKENQENHTFLVTDFLNHFIDIDGDSISTVMFFNNVSRLRYNGVAYNEGTEIPMADIQLGKLVYIAPIVEIEEIGLLSYKIRDTNNNIVE